MIHSKEMLIVSCSFIDACDLGAWSITPVGVKVVFTPDDLSVAAPSMKAAFNGGPGQVFHEKSSTAGILWQ